MIVPANPDMAFKHISLGGNSEFISHTEILDRANQFCTEISPLLSINDEAQLRSGMQALAIHTINEKFQASIKMNKPPEERITVRKVVRTGNGAYIQDMQTPSCIYERDEKEFKNSEERATWQPRINMIERAFACRQIFSLSIVPLDPSNSQTWYDRKNSCRPDPLPPVNEQELHALFGFLPPNEGPSTAIEWKMNHLTSDKKATINHPSEVLSGFFAPFSTFSSELATPQYDPEHLPACVTVVDAFSEEKVKAMVATFENNDLRNRIKSVVDSFVDDVHAQGLGLTVLQAPKVKIIYFKK